MAGQKVLAEHLAGHLGYLDASYREVSSEQAGAEYLKVEDVLTIGAPIEFKEKAKELNGKLQMQGESIEGLRAINDRLQNQMQAMQEQNAALQGRLEQIEQAAEEQRAAVDKLNTLARNLTPRQLADIAKIVAQKKGTAD